MNFIHDDGSLTLDNASVQRLMDMGVLHYTDEGIYAGRWPVTNTPSREHVAECDIYEGRKCNCVEASTMTALSSHKYSKKGYSGE